MKYHCIHCSKSLKRSEVERFPDQPANTEYRKHINCTHGDPFDSHGTAILIGTQNPNWTDEDETAPAEQDVP